MAKKDVVYECMICGNVVETLRGGKGELICCGELMKEHQPKTKDTGMEKHTPVVEITPTEIVVRVGEVAHPMEEKHHIEWIEYRGNDGVVSRQYLSLQDEPKASFCTGCTKGAKVLTFCNIHGLWITVLDSCK